MQYDLWCELLCFIYKHHHQLLWLNEKRAVTSTTRLIYLLLLLLHITIERIYLMVYNVNVALIRWSIVVFRRVVFVLPCEKNKIDHDWLHPKPRPFKQFLLSTPVQVTMIYYSTMCSREKCKHFSYTTLFVYLLQTCIFGFLVDARTLIPKNLHFLCVYARLW